jgi:hypothetical protein
MDHNNLVERIDTGEPKDSLALRKPTLAEPHEGGKRLTPGTWEYHLFLKWIQTGANGVNEPEKLTALEVVPKEIVFSGPQQKQALKAIAVWLDGSREDVTCLCRFKTNDDAICGIDNEGVVTSGAMGDSHVVVFYDNAVVSVPVLRPVSDRTGEKYPRIAGRTEIDQRVIEKLRKLGVVPSAVCDDADFLRRVSLDITGTLPTAGEVKQFLADHSPDKRERKIDELLATPAYTAWWTTQICDWTGCSDEQLNNVNPADNKRGSRDWYDWVYERVAANVPYDQLCEHIILAHGRRPQESYAQYCERMSHYAQGKDGGFANQDGLVYFWGRKNFTKNEDRAIGFAYTFMGTRIQCAQCHKHPFDIWTKQDFAEFEQFFNRVRFAQNGADRNVYQQMVKELGLDGLKGNDQRKGLEKAVEQGKTIPFPEIVIQKLRSAEAEKKKAEQAKAKKKNYTPALRQAKLLGEETVELDDLPDPRTALMDWLRNSPTRLFAKAIVNRVWANYFNRGIVEPTDDLSLANPPCNAALLDYLVQGFIEHRYDLKWLHREICLSDTYQRAWQPNETNLQDERNFSRSVPRRLAAESAYDALVMATANDRQAAAYRTDLTNHATAKSSPPRKGGNGGNDYALTVFGRSVRESNCDCDRSSQASLLQTLFVRNDGETLKMLDRPDSWIQQLGEGAGKTEKNSGDGDRARQQLEREIRQLQREVKQARKSGDALEKQTAERQLAAAERKLQHLAEPAPSAGPATHAKPPQPATHLVDEAYLRTLSRFPTDDERRIALTYVHEAQDEFAGLKDVLWALINTKEFIVNH